MSRNPAMELPRSRSQLQNLNLVFHNAGLDHYWGRSLACRIRNIVCISASGHVGKFHAKY